MRHSVLETCSLVNPVARKVHAKSEDRLRRKVAYYASKAPKGYDPEDFAQDLWVKTLTASVGPKADALPLSERLSFITGSVWRHTLNLRRSFRRRVELEDAHDPEDPLLDMPYEHDHEVLLDLEDELKALRRKMKMSKAHFARFLKARGLIFPASAM